jgi:hypothetical protein
MKATIEQIKQLLIELNLPKPMVRNIINRIVESVVDGDIKQQEQVLKQQIESLRTTKRSELAVKVDDKDK